MLKHLSIQTEKTYVHWVKRYGAFLHAAKLLPDQPSETKMKAFLTSLARTGVAAATQNQAFNALLFLYRDVLKQELVKVDALRAQRPASLRYCPTQAEVYQLLANVADIYGYALPPHRGREGGQPINKLCFNSEPGRIRRGLVNSNHETTALTVLVRDMVARHQICPGCHGALGCE
jgi:hypothetical protein